MLNSTRLLNTAEANMRRRDPSEEKLLRKKKLLLEAKVQKAVAVGLSTSLLLFRGKMSPRN